jgi:hypothetical protein
MLAMATVRVEHERSTMRLYIVASMVPAAMLTSVMIVAVSQTSAHRDLCGRASRDLLKQGLFSDIQCFDSAIAHLCADRTLFSE